MNDKNKTTGGIGFCGLLQIAFVILKLCGVIAWNWWWVLAPTWVPLSLIIVAIIVVLSTKS